MKYADIKALLHVNHTLKAARKEWDNEAYIMVEGNYIVVVRKHDPHVGMGFIKTVYTPVYQDLISNDWEIIA